MLLGKIGSECPLASSLSDLLLRCMGVRLLLDEPRKGDSIAFFIGGLGLTKTIDELACDLLRVPNDHRHPMKKKVTLASYAVD